MKINVSLSVYLVIISICLLNTTTASHCKIKSQIIAVDKVKNRNYDILLSISTKDKCSITCKISENQKINGFMSEYSTAKLMNQTEFHKRTYYFFKFENLTQYKQYNYACNDNIPSYFAFPKTNNETLRISAFGDWSICRNGNNTLKYLLSTSQDRDLITLMGDQAYDLADDNGKVGNRFLEFIKPLTSQTPYMVSTGNHEFKDNYADYMNRFYMPNKAKTNNKYYSYNAKNTHFVSMNSESAIKNETDLNEFKNWLLRDLEAANLDKNIKWKVVYFHRPLYCSDFKEKRCNKESDILRANFEKIFLDTKVDLVLNGHVHSYERFYPIYNKTVDYEAIRKDRNIYDNPKYPAHVICGFGGNVEGVEPYEKTTELSHTVILEAGVCNLNFTDTKMSLDYVNVTDWKTIDYFEINKNSDLVNLKYKEEEF